MEPLKRVPGTKSQFGTRYHSPFRYLVPAAVFHLSLATAFAAEDALQFARGEYHLIQREFALALEEFGRLPKEHQQDPTFQWRVNRALAALYRAQSRAGRPGAKGRPSSTGQIRQRLRVTHRKEDAERLSDRSFDNRGWQVNEHLSAQVEDRDGLRGRFVMDLDGFKNGHNDLRYRTLLADFFQEPSHFAIGDSASFTSPYFLLGSRLRGLNLILKSDTNEFQAVAGGYPFWLEERDEYIYPRTVLGVRDRQQFLEGRFSLGANLMNTRDSEKIRTIDVANQPRENTVLSLDQSLKLIPEVWSIKAAQAYSITDDNLLEDRLAPPTKLKGSSSEIESLLSQPWFTLRSHFERIGPDFRALTGLSAGSVVNVKGYTSDRQYLQHLLDLKPWGPLDLDLETSWYRNNLDNDDTLEHTRQAWYAAHLGVLTPPAWPRPRLRALLIDTVSSPGSTTRPSQIREWNLRAELTHQWRQASLTGFGTYELEHPLKDNDSFDKEIRRLAGIRISSALLDRIWVSSSHQYSVFDGLFDTVLEKKGGLYEANSTFSTRLWGSSSLSLHSTYLHGEIIHPTTRRLARGEGVAYTATFQWPYTWKRPDKRRIWSVFPHLAWHWSQLGQAAQERPLFTSRLSLAYEAYLDWKLELMGEYRYDDDADRSEVDTQGSRFWLLWTSYWR